MAKANEKRREKLIQQYESEIKQRHLQIEKKQLYVDRLNREYDEKRKKLEEELGEAVESAGPLEVKTKTLRKQIAERGIHSDITLNRAHAAILN